MVFVGVLCGTLVMVGASFAPIENHGMKIALILAIAAANATTVATFLMHIITEKRFIHVVLAFTAFFALALFVLTSIAHHDRPRVESTPSSYVA